MEEKEGWVELGFGAIVLGFFFLSREMEEFFSLYLSERLSV